MLGLGMRSLSKGPRFTRGTGARLTPGHTERLVVLGLDSALSLDRLVVSHDSQFGPRSMA